MNNPTSKEELEAALREGMVEAELGLCMFGPISDVSKFFEHLEHETPETDWATNFLKNPFRLRYIEADFETMTQKEFEEAFGAEPVWGLNAMAEHAENSLAFANIYDGCKLINKGQIMRAMKQNPNLDGEALVRCAQATAEYTTALYDNVSEMRFQPMIKAISEATKANL